MCFYSWCRAYILSGFGWEHNLGNNMIVRNFTRVFCVLFVSSFVLGFL